VGCVGVVGGGGVGRAKEEVHRSEPRTLDELEQEIRDTCAAVSVVLLKEKC